MKFSTLQPFSTPILHSWLRDEVEDALDRNTHLLCTKFSLGVAIFALGVIALGRAVENCLNASTISAEENVVRQLLSDRMAQVQAASAVPEAEKEFKLKTSYGRVTLTQKALLLV